MKPKLNAEASLVVVGWLYTAAGAYAAIELLVGFFAPLDRPLIEVHVFIPEENLAVLLLPLGIGLLWQSRLCRLTALILSWLSVATIIAVGLLFSMVFFKGGDLQLIKLQTGSTGDQISRTIAVLLIGVPLFIWQLRVLSSEAVKRLTGKAKPGGIEHV